MPCGRWQRSCTHVQDTLPLPAWQQMSPSPPLTNTQARRWSVFEDRCPHRLAPLSEGRIEPSTGHLMCSYHGGWGEGVEWVRDCCTQEWCVYGWLGGWGVEWTWWDAPMWVRVCEDAGGFLLEGGEWVAG